MGIYCCTNNNSTNEVPEENTIHDKCQPFLNPKKNQIDVSSSILNASTVPSEPSMKMKEIDPYDRYNMDETYSVPSELLYDFEKTMTLVFFYIS